MSKILPNIHRVAAPHTGEITPENMVLFGKQLTTTKEKVSLFFKTIFHFLSQGYQLAKQMRVDYFINKTLSLVLSSNLQLLSDKTNGLGQGLIQRQIDQLSSKGIVIGQDTEQYRFIQSLHRCYEIIQEGRANPETHWLKHFETEELLGKNFEKFESFSKEKNHLKLILSFDDFLKDHPDLQAFLSNLPANSPTASALLKDPLSPEIFNNRYNKLLRFQDRDTPRQKEMAREFISALAPDLIEKSQINDELKAIGKLIKFCEKEIDSRQSYSPQFLATSLKTLMEEKGNKGLIEFSRDCDAVFNGDMVKSMKGICERLAEEMKKQEIKEENVLKKAVEAIKNDPFDAVYHFVPRMTENLVSEQDKPKVADIRAALLPIKVLFNQSSYVNKGVKALTTLLGFLPKDASPEVAKEFIGKKLNGFNALNIDELGQLRNRHAYRQTLVRQELGIWMTVVEMITDKLIDAHQKIASKSEEKDFFIDFIKTTLPKVIKERESVKNQIGRIQKLLRIPGAGWMLKKILKNKVFSAILENESIDKQTKEMVEKSLEPISQIILLLAPAILNHHNIEAHLNFLQNLNGLLSKEQLNDDTLFIEVMKGLQQLTKELANYGPPLEKALTDAKDQLMA